MFLVVQKDLINNSITSQRIYEIFAYSLSIFHFEQIRCCVNDKLDLVSFFFDRKHHLRFLIHPCLKNKSLLCGGRKRERDREILHSNPFHCNQDILKFLYHVHLVNDFPWHLKLLFIYFYFFVQLTPTLQKNLDKIFTIFLDNLDKKKLKTHKHMHTYTKCLKQT